MTDATPHIYPCGDNAITIALGDAIDSGINQKIISFFQYVKNNPPEGLRDIVPAYNTLTLVYDTVLLKKKDPSILAYDQMRSYLEALLQKANEQRTASRIMDIPVCYDLTLAPDLSSLAALHALSVEAVINIHTSTPYRVYMIGFLPGFVYMGSVDERIQTPRKAKPRTVVPAGSVGIAGAQTGIYPFDSPGGWQLIGQTPLRLFDAKKEAPCLFEPGDEVRFHAVSIDAFTKMKDV